MEFSTRSSPHQIGSQSVTRVMGLVLIGLVPGTVAMWWYFGWGVIINIAIATAVAPYLLGSPTSALFTDEHYPTPTELPALTSEMLAKIAAQVMMAGLKARVRATAIPIRDAVTCTGSRWVQIRRASG